MGRRGLGAAGILPEVLRNRLGHRGALDPVIDPYPFRSITGPGVARVSDPNRPDDDEDIARLAGQLVRVSVETVQIVEGLPLAFGGPEGSAESVSEFRGHG